MNNQTPLRRFPSTRGFTLVEIMVVIGIIVLLVAILVPFLSKAFRKSTELRTQADLNSIAIAIEAYRQVFGDIPRTSGPNTGAATLCKALIGPYGDGKNADGTLDANDPPAYSATKAYKAGECVTSGKQYIAVQNSTGQAVTDTLYWAEFNPIDGA